jgi:hypothetical protein
MPSIHDVYASKYLSAGELKGRRIPVTIERAELVTMGQGADAKDKLVIYFDGKQKGMVLNQTNALTLEQIIGSEDYEQWVGRSITLYAAMVTFQGRVVPAIRIMPSVSQPARQAPKPAPQVSTSPLPPAFQRPSEADTLTDDDDVPF